MYGFPFHDGYPDDTSFFRDVDFVYTIYQKIAEKHDVDFIPGVFPGYNDRAVRLETDNFPIPHEVNAGLEGSGQYSTFREYLALARRVLSRSTSNREPTIMITSFNEFAEDTQIEPVRSKPSSDGPDLYTQGFEYQAYAYQLLQIVREFVVQGCLTPSIDPPSIDPASNDD